MKNKMHLLDLVARERLEEIIQVVTQATGVSSIITEVDGKPITNPHNFTSLCSKFCRSTEEGARRCRQSDHYGGAESARNKKFVIYECFNAGLLDCASPIIVDGYHIATVLMGQVLERERPIDAAVASQRARDIGVQDIEGYLRELGRVPLMDREKLTKIAGLMAVVTRSVSELALQQYLSDRRAKRYHHKLVNSVSDCIIATDADSIVTMVNNAGAVMLGFDNGEVVGRSIHSLFLDSSPIEIFQEKMARGGVENCRLELVVLGNNGIQFPVQLALSGLCSQSEIEGFVVVFRDISEEKMIERMKEDLVGMLTHDMGNHIISIQSALHLLVDQALGGLNDTQLEMLNLASGTGDQLLGIVTDFLDIYRSENGQFLLRKHLINIESIIVKSVDIVKLFAMEKKVEIISAPSSNTPEFKADYTRVLRTCVNLLDNAVKYSPEEGTIEVEIKTISQNGKDIPASIADRLEKGLTYCLVSVSDSGPGVPEEYHKEIFDKFFKIRSGDRMGEGRKGAGLGLAFCWLVVYAHNGYIWVESPISERGNQRDKGCRFNFVLPLAD